MILEVEEGKEIDFRVNRLLNDKLLNYAKQVLPNHGHLMKLSSESGPYYYLKIPDDFILKLFPFLSEENFSVPDYFDSPEAIGAHISVMYDNEMPTDLNSSFNSAEMGKIFHFEPIDIYRIEIFNKELIALIVSSPTLEALRHQYGLKSKLNYRGLLVPFHITLAKSISHNDKMEDKC